MNGNEQNSPELFPIGPSDNDVFSASFVSHLDPAFRSAAGNIEVLEMSTSISPENTG
jgi:hypothetical protein